MNRAMLDPSSADVGRDKFARDERNDGDVTAAQRIARTRFDRFRIDDFIDALNRHRESRACQVADAAFRRRATGSAPSQTIRVCSTCPSSGASIARLADGAAIDEHASIEFDGDRRAGNRPFDFVAATARCAYTRAPVCSGQNVMCSPHVEALRFRRARQ